LNASTFAVRVAASTGATPAACLLAGLATLSGPRHGGMTVRVAQLLRACKLQGSAAKALREDRASPRPVHAFGHPLYPDGDPRATALLGTFECDPVVADLLRAARRQQLPRPNIDLALVALQRRYRLPAGSAFTLFALGRSAGWLAHAIEQHSVGKIIRPRAQYLDDQVTGKPRVQKSPPRALVQSALRTPRPSGETGRHRGLDSI
jgi:citrate synthase